MTDTKNMPSPEEDHLGDAEPQPHEPGEEDVVENNSNLENPVSEEAESNGEAPGEEMDPMEALELEVAKWKDLALRTQANLENYRKRMSREQEESRRYANTSLVSALLPVLDNFALGLQAARQSTDPTGVLMGMEMVEKQIQDFLADQKVESIRAQPGDAFDPAHHEAMMQEYSNDIPAGDIVREIRSGYMMNGRLLRAASVVVSKGVENPGDEATFE